MSQCTDKAFERNLEFYLLDLLSDDVAAAFEEHMLMCSHCADEVARFNAESLQLLTSDAIKEKIAEAVADADRGALTTNVIPVHRWWHGSRARWGLVATAAIIVIAAVLPWKLQLQLGDETVATPTRVAVFPFDNASTDTTVDWEARAISSLLITDLTDSKGLSLIPEYVIQSLVDHRRVRPGAIVDDAAKVKLAAESGARWVVLGSIIKSQPSLAVVVAVIDPRTRDTAAVYTSNQGSGQDLFGVVEKLSESVAPALTPSAPSVDSSKRRVSDMTTRSVDAYRHYLEGVDHFYQLRLPEAEQSFSRALEYDSTMAMAYFYLSQIESKIGLADRQTIGKALTYIEHATVRDRYYIRAWGALALGDTAHALAHLLSLTEAYPDESEAFFLLATIEAVRSHYPEAIRYAQASIARDPYKKTAINLLAYSYQWVGDNERALATLDRYIALVPNEVNPLDSRGEILACQGRFEEAVESYSSALAVDSNFHSSRINKTYLLLLLDRFNAAQDEITYLLNAGDAEGRSWGRTLQLALPIRQGQWRHTLAMIPEALNKDAAEGESHGLLMKRFIQLHLMVALRQTGDVDRALDRLAPLYEQALPSSRIDFLKYKGQILADVGKTSEASQLALDLLQDFGETDGRSRYDNIMGIVMLNEGNYADAIEHLERANRARTDYTLRYSLARAYVGQGQHEKAIALLESMLRSFEWKRALWGMIDVKLHYYLGIAYEEAGQNTQAVSEYEHLLRLWRDADVALPELADARERLARLKSRS